MEQNIKNLILDIKKNKTQDIWVNFQTTYNVIIDNRENVLQALFNAVDYNLPIAIKGSLKKILFIYDLKVVDNEVSYMMKISKKFNCDNVRCYIDELLKIILSIDATVDREFNKPYITDTSKFNNKYNMRERDTYEVLNKCLGKYCYDELYRICSENKFETFYKNRLINSIDDLLEKSPNIYTYFGQLVIENYDLISKQILEKIEMHTKQLSDIRSENNIKIMNINKEVNMLLND